MPGVFDSTYDDFHAFARVNGVRSIDETPESLGDIRRASFGLIAREGRSSSAYNSLDPFIQDRADMYEQMTGDDGAFMRRHTGFQQLRRTQIREMITMGELVRDEIGKVRANSDRARGAIGPDADMIHALFEIDRMSVLHPGEFLTDNEIDQQVAAGLKVQRERDEATLARSKGGGGALMQFVGAAGAAITDPLVLATLPLGLGALSGPSVTANFAKAFFSEAAIATLAEIPIQSSVFSFKERINSPYTFKDAAYNVLAAGVGAGLLRGAGSVTIDVAKKALTKFKAKKPVVESRTPQEQQAVEELDHYVDAAEKNPLGVENEAAHLDAVDKAAGDVDSLRAPVVDEIVGDIEPVRADPDIPGKRMYRAEDIETFDPRELAIDAETFQFKTGGNDEGVTRAFKDIDDFRIEQAGQVIVYEDLAGKRFIVDGHQRMGIARRAIARGQDPDTVTLFGVVLRESDGVSRGEARALAAYKNIAEGTGTGIDAAKIMRESAQIDQSVMPSLPAAGIIAARGRSLSRLSDEAFQSVVNEVIPEDFGGIVGEMMSDPALQQAAIATLARVEPANQAQAREVIKQVREAGATFKDTGDMFGGLVAESLVLERAKVVDDALRVLRQETRTFKTLVQKQGEIEGAGKNVLDEATNKQQVVDNAKASEILKRQAHQSGPISEAVQRAAERLKAGDPRKQVTTDFIGDLNTAITRDQAPSGKPAEAAAGAQADVTPPAGKTAAPEGAKGPLIKAWEEAELFTDHELDVVVQRANDILNDQDVDIPTQIIDRGTDQELITKGGRQLFDEIDGAEQAIIDVATCRRAI